MPEAAPTTIELPPMPLKPAADTTAATPEPGRTPMSAVFDRALASQMPTPESAPAEPSQRSEVGDQRSEGQTQPDPAKPDVQKPVPPVEDFVPPEILTGEATATPPVKEPSVAELMPEEPGPAIRTKEGKEKYEKWRGHQLKLETENKGLKEQLKNQGPADQNVLAENQLLKQRLTEMSGVVERAMLTEHPAFQEQFVKPHKAAIEAATQLLKDVELDPALLSRALNATGKDRRKAMDEINESIESPTTRMELVDLMVKINGLEQQRDAALSDIKGSREQLDLRDRAERHQAAQQQAQQMGQLIDSVVDTLRDKHGIEFFKKIPGNDKWNERVDQRVSALRELAVNSTNYEEMVATMALGVQALDYRASWLSERTRRIAVDKELAEMKGATPGLNGTGGGAGAPATTEERTGIAAIFDRAKESGTFGS